MTIACNLLTPKPVEAVAALLNWYFKNARRLPWRMPPQDTRNADPYHVWLSEIMLQQTTVATVIAYYEKFLSRWPRLSDLADSPLEAILSNWAGLGYYARARNLHQTAVIVRDHYQGRFPDDIKALQQLPGIGDYSANAIHAIAFNKPSTVMDGNIERIIARYYQIETNFPQAKKEARALTALFSQACPAGQHKNLPQALMDLGASLCTPKTPSCPHCPLQNGCRAFQAGKAGDYPKKTAKKAKPTRQTIGFWLEANGHILLERRPAKGLLGGMPGFFTSPWEIKKEADIKDCFDPISLKNIGQSHAPIAGDWQILEGISHHSFTHFHLESRLAYLKIPTAINMEKGFWQPATQLDFLPSLFKKMAYLKKWRI